MFKPNSHLRLSSFAGSPLAVNQSLIELSQTTAGYVTRDDISSHGGTMEWYYVLRESLKIIGSQMNSYLSWFALYRHAQDVKQE